MIQAVRSAVAAVLLLLPPASARAAVEDLATHPQVADAIAAFDVVVQKIALEREQPGLSVGLVYGDRLIWARGYGFSDLAKRTPATPATAYRIASITKLFTATAILQLRDAGKLRLDDPVVKHLPWFAPKDSFADDPPITIRHLMTHTSGLLRELDMPYWDDGRFPDHDALVRMVNEAWTVQPREKELKYSNVAVALEGEIVTAVSGEPWADYVKRHILDPLGMTHTAAIPTPDMPALTTGYYLRVPGQPRRVAPFLDKKAMSPCGSIASTVEDLARFIALQFADTASSDPVVLKGSSLREMHRVQFLNADWTRGYGLGWQVRRVGDQVRIQHGGSVPGNLTMIAAAPAERFGVIVLTNADDGKPDLYVEKAWSMVAPAVKKAVAEAGKRPTTDPAWARYAGEYEWVDGTTSKVLLLSDGLYLLDMTADDPWADRIRLEPVAPGVFRLKGGSQQDELVRFDSDAAGRVVRLREPGYSARRRCGARRRGPAPRAGGAVAGPLAATRRGAYLQASLGSPPAGTRPASSYGPPTGATATGPFWLALCLAFLIQGYKGVMYYLANRRWNFRRFFETGGMPSSHSAAVSALSTAVGLREGFTSALFGVTLYFSLVIMYDAAGLRRAAGRQAAILNRLIEEHFAHIDSDRQQLMVLLGHTPFEVAVGAVLGVASAFVWNWVF